MKSRLSALAVAGAILLPLVPQAAHAGFVGNNLLIEWHFSSLGSVIASENNVVGAGVEFAERFGGSNIDVADSTIRFFGADATSYSPASFNGFVFTDVNGTIDDIIGVSISGQSGYTTFDAADISFTANSIAVNFQNVGDIGGDSEVTLTVRFANQAVPEPIGIALLGLGLAGLAVTRRRRA